MIKKILNTEDLPTSARHFIKVLAIIFTAELLTVPLMIFLADSKSKYLLMYHVVEILTIPLACAVFVWWAVVHPLRRVAIREIAGLDEALKKLESTVSILEATLESTGDGIIVLDRNKRIVAYNKKYIELWSIPEDVIERRDAYEVFDHMSPQLVDPDWFLKRSLDVYENKFQDVLDVIHLTDGRIFERQSQPQKIDGVTVGRVSSYRDVTERTRAVQALVESEARFRQIFYQTDNAQFIFDADLQTTLDLNPAAELLFECERDELVRKPPSFFFAPVEYDKIRRAQLDTVSGNVFWIDNMKHSSGDGNEMHLSAHGRKIELGGQPVILCTVIDITEKMLLDKQARDLQANLIQTNKMTSLGVLVTGIAHEINNPNNYIMLSSELLSTVWKDMRVILAEYHESHGDFSLGGIPYTSLQNDIQELLDSITEGSNRIKDIINTLKDFARDGKGTFRNNIDLNQVVSQVTTIISHQIARHTRHFSLKTTPGLPPVSGNQQQLEQVIINLILNAIQALPSPDRSVCVSTCFDTQAGTVCIEVSDQGDGIPTDISERVMDPFFTTKLDSGGSGLGLSISQAIIRSHKGSLTFTSSPGQGTRFLVQLPTTSNA